MTDDIEVVVLSLDPDSRWRVMTPEDLGESVWDLERQAWDDWLDQDREYERSQDV